MNLIHRDPLTSPLAALLLATMLPSGALEPWDDYPRVLSSERVLVAVVATVNRYQLIVLVRNPDPAGYLLLTAKRPLPPFHYAELAALERCFFINDKTGERGVGYELVPPVGYAWQVPLERVQTWEMPST